MTELFSIWDVVLLAVVPLQAVGVAYCYQPKHKAFLLSLPIPFTIAVLAIGKGVTIENVIGLSLTLAYAHSVRWLHQDLKMNILVAIAVSALGYCLTGFALAGKIPDTTWSFLAASLSVMAIGVIAWFATPCRHENGSRTTLPWYIKYPAVFMVILGLLLIKKWLSGFMAMFPMIGVVTSYEARYCLWSICRQMPIILIATVPMMATIRLFQDNIGIYAAIGLGWLVLALFLIPLMKITWDKQTRAAQPNSKQPTDRECLQCFLK